jgi:hypothetical protein
MKIFTFYFRTLSITVWSGDPFTTAVWAADASDEPAASGSIFLRNVGNCTPNYTASQPQKTIIAVRNTNIAGANSSWSVTRRACVVKWQWMGAVTILRLIFKRHFVSIHSSKVSLCARTAILYKNNNIFNRAQLFSLLTRLDISVKRKTSSGCKVI